MKAALRRAALLAALFTVPACGGPPGRSAGRGPGPDGPGPDDDAVIAPWPDPDVRSLQLYVVLTDDPLAMQGPDAFPGVDAAVNGGGARYEAVRRRAVRVPNGYRVDFTVDFAELPHPALAPAQLAHIVQSLPPEARRQAEKATLGVLVRSDARLLPHGDHVRLAGLVPLYIADRWKGVVVDLLARRAWTPDAWQAELAAPALSDRQIRLVTREDDGGGQWLLTRGNPKFGLPDLELRGIAPALLPAARARFAAALDLLRREGPSAAPKALCTGPRGTYDADCRRLE